MNPLARVGTHLGRNLRSTALEEAARAVGTPTPDARPLVTASDLADLPEPAQRYLRFMGVVGQPRDRSFCVRFVGRFRRGPSDRWMPCEAWQVNASDPVSRVFHMRIDALHVIPMVGRDTYIAGRGAMHGKVLGLIPVADGEGEPFDIGELVTYVNDALMLAPSMLLCERTTWTSSDGHSFRITFTDAGRTVTAVVEVDRRGALRDFSTTDRFMDGPDGPLRTRWTTPVDRWVDVGGRTLPADGRANWHPDGGTFTYVDGRFDLDTLEYDVLAAPAEQGQNGVTPDVNAAS